jgi:hypothetical protein
VSDQPPPSREEIVKMLASYGERPLETVAERIDSMELAWLIHVVEQTHRVRLDLGDEALGRMSTVSGAVDVLREALAGARQG